MKLFQNLWVWVFTDNDAMDVTLIESTPTESSELALAQQTMQDIAVECDYPKNVINLLDYIKLKEHAY